MTVQETISKIRNLVDSINRNEDITSMESITSRRKILKECDDIINDAILAYPNELIFMVFHRQVNMILRDIDYVETLYHIR